MELRRYHHKDNFPNKPHKQNITQTPQNQSTSPNNPVEEDTKTTNPINTTNKTNTKYPTNTKTTTDPTDTSQYTKTTTETQQNTKTTKSPTDTSESTKNPSTKITKTTADPTDASQNTKTTKSPTDTSESTKNPSTKITKTTADPTDATQNTKTTTNKNTTNTTIPNKSSSNSTTIPITNINDNTGPKNSTAEHPMIKQMSDLIGSFTENTPVSQIPPFILLGGCILIVILITVLIVICCRKYHNRQLFQQTPQNFSNRPDLSLPQLLRFRKQVVSVTSPEGQQITRQETYEGKFLQVKFKTHNNCIYFSNKLQKDCYFQIEVIKLSSIIQIGYIHTADIKQLKKQVGGQDQINLDQQGVSVRTDGTTYVYGNNSINFPWKLEYGDTIGIGITKHEGSFRAWITKNGVVQNPPSQQQRIKHIQVEKDNDNDKATTKKQNKQVALSEQEQNQKRKQDLNSAKRKIQLKASRKFSYYAVIVSEGPMQPPRQSIINWNIGGQAFRLFDAKKMVGLLR